MSQRILFVDDDEVILAAIRHQLRKRFEFDMASNAEEALALLQNEGPYAVIVSDMHMPDMDGVTLLAKAREICPDIVRVILTGVADLQAAIDAVNRGSVFRFLTKPWPSDVLVAAVTAGIEQYRLVSSERLLLERTLVGGVQVLTEVLSLANPTAFRRTAALRDYVQHIAAELDLHDRWQIELAATLSQIGCVSLPEETLRKAYLGDPLSADERDLYARRYSTGARLLSHIPRLEVVAAMIGRQEEGCDAALTFNAPDDEVVRIGSQVLRVALALDLLLARGLGQDSALAWLAHRPGDYPPRMVASLATLKTRGDGRLTERVYVQDLRVGMVVAEDVLTANGAAVLPAGARISEPVEARLRSYARIMGLQEPVLVYAS